MKAVKTVDLGQTSQTDPFLKAVAVEKAAAAEMVRKTFNLEKRHQNQINAVAADLSETAGKPIGASEALRHILDEAAGKVGS